MNYKIIHDEQKLREFINWLPNIAEHETYYVTLIARKKYAKDDPTMKHGKKEDASIRRFTTKKERLLERIQALECPLDSYKQYGNPIPQEAIALYINLNPRDMIKATQESVTKLTSLAFADYNGYDPYQVVMSALSKAKSKTRYVDFDFDVPSKDGIFLVKEKMDLLIGSEAYKILVTRGGYHILVDPTKVTRNKNTWHQTISKMEHCDLVGDKIIPIPGTIQGGFTPYFYN